MNIKVLIISSLYDFSTDLVTQELEKRNITYLRINRESFTDYRISIDPIKSILTVKIGSRTFTIDSNIKSIWYRQPIFLRNSPGESLTISEQLKRSQWMAFLRSLSIFDNAQWMNHLEATYLAETKAYQLMIASSLGFNVPTTVIGNDINEFSRFNGEVIIKSLDTVLLREKDDCLFTYSTLENVNSLSDEEVFETPMTIQEYIYPKIDIRVTIIGNRIFSVKIMSDGQGINDDWRIIDRNKIEYSNTELPEDVKLLCFKLMSNLKLNFGAIDLILQNENYVFIEVNPTGEWGWIVDEGRRIDLAITDWLIQDQ